MDEKQRPPHVRIVGEGPHHIRNLCLTYIRSRWVFAVHQEEEDILVDEVEVVPAESLLPDLEHRGVRDVVVPGDVEERHVQCIDHPFHFGPLCVQRRHILRVAFDNITDRNDELRLKQVDPFHRLCPDPGTMPSGVIRDDHELEVVRVVFEVEMRPGVDFLLVNLELAMCGVGMSQDEQAKQGKGSHGFLSVSRDGHITPKQPKLKFMHDSG